MHELIDEFQGHDAHFSARKIADRVRQFNQRVPFHATALELMHCCVLEYLRQDHRRGNAAFFELHCVVHTAQRARASPAHRGSGDIDFVRQFINEFLRSGF